MDASSGRIIGIVREASALLDSMYSNGPMSEISNCSSAVIVGDTHTAYSVSEMVFSRYLESTEKIVFLGDYVDRGNTGIENLYIILREFLKAPDKVVILRGNHESPIMNEIYGFKDEVSTRMGEKYYRYFSELFSKMPYAAVINGYLCLHGGIARNISSPEDIQKLPRNDVRPYNETAFEILWNDPGEGISGFLRNIRGPGTYLFGEDVLTEFLENNGLKGLIRGHEAVDAFRDNFGGKVTTVFSSLYHGRGKGILRLHGPDMEKIML